MSQMGYGRAPMPHPYWGVPQRAPYNRYTSLPYGGPAMPPYAQPYTAYSTGRPTPMNHEPHERSRSMSGDYSHFRDENNNDRRMSGSEGVWGDGHLYAHAPLAAHPEGGPQWRASAPNPHAAYPLSAPQSYPPRGHISYAPVANYPAMDSSSISEEGPEGARRLAAEALMELSTRPWISSAASARESPNEMAPVTVKAEEPARARNPAQRLSRTVFPTPPMTPPAKRKPGRKKAGEKEAEGGGKPCKEAVAESDPKPEQRAPVTDVMAA